jgi:NADPH:quinone reductase-like Zn-dependent oxidoreductase
LNLIASLLDEGRLEVEVGAVMGLDCVRLAHEMLEGARPRPRGKIVLRVEG